MYALSIQWLLRDTPAILMYMVRNYADTMHANILIVTRSSPERAASGSW